MGMNDRQNLVTPTLQAHRRQFLWQILAPFLLLAALILAGAVWIVVGGANQARLWADVSLIWLLAPMLVLALAFTIVLGALIYGLARLSKAAPRLTGRAQELADIGARGVRRVADGATQPFVWYKQAGSVVRSALAFMLGKK
jgi:membrane protein implicated in regulation of membrane protease activity